MSSLHPDMFQPYHNSGRIMLHLGRYEEAAAMFEKAHALDPRHAMPLWNLWELRLNRLNDPEGAEAHAHALAALQPDNGWVRHVGAWTDVARRRFDTAEAGMREVLAELPLHQWAFPNLGHLLMRRGAAGEAATVYGDLLAKVRSGVIAVNQIDVTMHLGLALAAAGRQADADSLLSAEIDRVSARLR